MTRLKKIIGFLLISFFLYQGIMAIGHPITNNPYADSIIRVFISISWGGMAGLTFIFFFLPDLVTDMVDCLLSPRRYLDRRPPVVSPAIGNMERGDLATAQKQLDALLEEMPDSPYLCNVRFKFFIDFCKNDLAAIEEIERYFSRPDRIAANENAPLLLRYSELAVPNGKSELCMAIISRELTMFRRLYCKRDRELLRNRLDTLTASK